MTNVSAPSGFRAARHLAGGVPNRLSRYEIASAGAFNLYRGDVVVPVGTNKRIARPTAGTDRPIGIFNGVNYLDTVGAVQFKKKWATGTVLLTGSVAEAYVYDDPFTIFRAQSTGAFVVGDIGAFADYTIGTGNDLTETSGDEVAANAGAGATLKIIDYARNPENEIGTNAKLLVSFAIHYLRGAQTAI
jgi:hypothetical protein